MRHVGSDRKDLSHWSEWLTVLREDYKLAVLTLAGVVAVVWLVPFAIYRAVTGNWLAFATDVSLSLVFGWAAWYAWRTGTTRLPGWVAAVAIVVGIWLIGAAAQFSALFWAYPGILILFFLVPTSSAAMFGVVAVVGAAVLSWQELGGGEGLPFFLVTCVLTGLFGYLVSQQAQDRIARWQSLSFIDPLTGVGNRRLLNFELLRARAQKGSVGTLVVLDVDLFKSINDRYGHDTGDAVLRDFAAAVQGALRATDRLYRVGGEEFVLWLPQHDPATVSAVTERVRTAVRRRVRVNGESVTFSAGIATHTPGENWEACLRRADHALYRAKQAGRDRILWSDSDPLPPRA